MAFLTPPLLDTHKHSHMPTHCHTTEHPHPLMGTTVQGTQFLAVLAFMPVIAGMVVFVFIPVFHKQQVIHGFIPYLIYGLIPVFIPDFISVVIPVLNPVLIYVVILVFILS